MLFLARIDLMCLHVVIYKLQDEIRYINVLHVLAIDWKAFEPKVTCTGYFFSPYFSVFARYRVRRRKKNDFFFFTPGFYMKGER